MFFLKVGVPLSKTEIHVLEENTVSLIGIIMYIFKRGDTDQP